MESHRGTVQKGSCQTLTCQGGESVGVMINNSHIRKLTPSECFKLMGFTKDDCDSVSYQSDVQKYHEAGDSIVVTVLMMILGQLLPIDEDDLVKLTENYIESIKNELP